MVDVKIYVAMVHERHSGTYPYPWSTAEAAKAYARGTAERYARYPDDIEEERIDEYLYYVRWSPEGDRAWVIEKELDSGK